MTTIPGFLTKTYEIFNSPDYTDCCGWGNNGSTIVIKKIEHFSKTVLPKYFKHSNFQSFVRQLNMYDFRKTVQDPNHGEFQHPNFRQDRPELLPNIKRKAHHKSSENNKKSLNGLQPEGSDFPSIDSTLSTASHVAAASLGNLSSSATHNYTENILNTGSSSTGKLIYENFKDDIINTGNDTDVNVRNQSVRDEFELRLQHIEVESVRVSTENIVLKQLIIDSRQKQAIMQDRMEKVLKTLFNIFMGNGAIVNNNLSTINSNNMNERNDINQNNMICNSASNDDKSENSLAVSSNSTDLVPVPSQPLLAPQMLESLLFRLDSLQSHGFRMNADPMNMEGGGDNCPLESMFGDEDILPLSDIAADITELVTSCRNGNLNDNGNGMNKNQNEIQNQNQNLFEEIIDGTDHIRNIYSNGYDNNNLYRLMSSTDKNISDKDNKNGINNHIQKNAISDYNKLENNFFLSSTTQGHGQGHGHGQGRSQQLRGQPLSQLSSFDTMASRVSAPNLLRLEELSTIKSEESNLDQPSIDSSVNHSRHNNNSGRTGNNNQEMSYGIGGPSSEVVFGGGELIRKSSIYPGHGNSDYVTQQSTGGLLSTNTSLSLLNGVSMDRQDSDNFSWSGLFSINSIDGYGLMSTSTDNNNFSLSSPGGSLNLTNTINSINENNRIKIKEEDVREIKHVKRGIAEIGINDGNHYINDKNGDNRDYNARRQKLSISCPPINSLSSNTNLNNIGNTITNCSTNSTNNGNLNQIQNLGSGSMDPPHGYYSQSNSESAQFGKNETSEPFYSNLQRSNPSETSLSRIDSLELTIATLLKSMDSFDANNNNNNNNNSNNNNNNNQMHNSNNNQSHAPS